MSVSARFELPPPPGLTEWLKAKGALEAWGAMRAEADVVRPERLRTIKATRLSFARSLVRRMLQERWLIRLAHFDVGPHGDGLLTYEIDAEGRQFTFVVFSERAGGVERSGRFCEFEFDFYGAVFDGRIGRDRIEREREQLVGRMWNGRTDNSCLGWTVANRSNRLFDHVVERLAVGTQPDAGALAAGGGYVVRNAGWYGNGRFGCRAWASFDPGHPFAHPYHLDVFALYLWRVVGFDIVEGAARARSRAAVPLDPELKAALGIGNSSGIGMVAALVRWPNWFGAFHLVRELALAYVKTRRGPVGRAKIERIRRLMARAARYYAEQADSPVPEIEPPRVIADQLAGLLPSLEELASNGTVAGKVPERPWAALAAWTAETCSAETAEQVNSLLIELEPEFTNALDRLLPALMAVDRDVRPESTVDEVLGVIRRRYGWALAIDPTAPGARHHFWYRSDENGENRRGERDVDPGVEKESFVDVANAVRQLEAALCERSPAERIGRFLTDHPEHAHAVGRVQLTARMPYTEIQGNIVDRDFLPMDGIRLLLSTFGLESSHPVNTRWVRGVFLQGAPMPEEIAFGEPSDWIFPSIGGMGRTIVAGAV